MSVGGRCLNVSGMLSAQGVVVLAQVVCMMRVSRKNVKCGVSARIREYQGLGTGARLSNVGCLHKGARGPWRCA